MKIEYRLPAKNVQYGYVNVEGTQEELMALDYDALGVDYIASVRRFWEAEEAGVQAQIKTDQAAKPEPEPERVNTYVPDESDQAEDLIVSELGATKISEEEAYDSPVSEAPKPWTAPAVFDFDN